MQFVGDRLKDCAARCGEEDRAGKGLLDLQNHISQFLSTAKHMHHLHSSDAAARYGAKKQVVSLRGKAGSTGTGPSNGDDQSLTAGGVVQGRIKRLSGVEGYPPSVERQVRGVHSASR